MLTVRLAHNPHSALNFPSQQRQGGASAARGEPKRKKEELKKQTADIQCEALREKARYDACYDERERQVDGISAQVEMPDAEMVGRLSWFIMMSTSFHPSRAIHSRRNENCCFQL